MGISLERPKKWAEFSLDGSPDLLRCMLHYRFASAHCVPSVFVDLSARERCHLSRRPSCYTMGTRRDRTSVPTYARTRRGAHRVESGTMAYLSLSASPARLSRGAGSSVVLLLPFIIRWAALRLWHANHLTNRWSRPRAAVLSSST